MEIETLVLLQITTNHFEISGLDTWKSSWNQSYCRLRRYKSGLRGCRFLQQLLVLSGCCNGRHFCVKILFFSPIQTSYAKLHKQRGLEILTQSGRHCSPNHSREDSLHLRENRVAIKYVEVVPSALRGKLFQVKPNFRRTLNIIFCKTKHYINTLENYQALLWWIALFHIFLQWFK